MPDRSGFSLAEVIIAMLVFAVGGLGLAASAAAIAKQIASNGIRSDVAVIASSRAETAQSAICGSVPGGEALKWGVRSAWTTDGISLVQRLERFDAFGSHADRFISALPCD